MHRTYYPHANGTRPYQVVVDGSRLSVRLGVWDASTERYTYDAELVPPTAFVRAFVGRPKGGAWSDVARYYSHRKSQSGCATPGTVRRRSQGRSRASCPRRPAPPPAPRIRLYDLTDGMSAASAAGNSVLFELGHGRCLFVGSSVFAFRTVDDESIASYRSPVGRNDVPYPFATGERHTYLLLENRYLPNLSLDADVPTNTRYSKDDPYGDFYYTMPPRDADKVSRLPAYRLIHDSQNT